MTEESSSLLNRLDITFPNILDRYVLREFLKILFLVQDQDARFVRACSRNEHARNHCLGGIVEEVFTCFRRAADVKRLKGSRVHRMSRNLKD